MGRGPTLYRLAADRRYADIPAHIESHPADVYWTDRYGSTALHILCQARNIDEALLVAVNAILRLAPTLAGWGNASTWTPLHFAVEQRPVAVRPWQRRLVLRLIRTCPEAVQQRTRIGFKSKTPFHIACEAAGDYEVLKAMLLIHPSLAISPYTPGRDKYGVMENPIQLLWRAERQQQQQQNQQQSLSSSSAAAQRTRKKTLNVDHLLGEIDNSRHLTLPSVRRKMDLLIQAAFAFFGSPDVPQHPFQQQCHPFPYLLHASCTVRVPIDYFTIVLRDHHSQAGERDDRGYLPLHYTILTASSDGMAYTQYCLEQLLEVYPSAAALPCNPQYGRLPLHMALETGHFLWYKGGLRTLVSAYPMALYQTDPRNGLLPFLISAQAANQSRGHFSATFELLRYAPDALVVALRDYYNSVPLTARVSPDDGDDPADLVGQFVVFPDHVMPP